MKDEFSDLWLSQATTQTPIDVEELRTRVDRLKARLSFDRTIGATAIILTLVMSAGSLLFFEEPVAAWFRAATYVLWVIYLIFTPATFRRRPPAPESRVLSLKTLAGSTPCIEFYRRELEDRLDHFRHGRVFVPILLVSGLMFALFAWKLIPGAAKALPAAVAGGIVMVLSIAWYVRIRRETPRIQAEIDDLSHREEAP
jgi:hypothetical protein